MIPVPSGVRVWPATGVTDMRRGMNGLTLQVAQRMGRDPYAAAIFTCSGGVGVTPAFALGHVHILVRQSDS
jgi:transposase